MNHHDHQLQLMLENSYTLESDQTVHELKVWPKYYTALNNRTKTFELRKNDRDFKVGDVLWLREYDWQKPVLSDRYTGRYLYKEVTYILQGGQFGLEMNFVIMSLADVE